MGEESPWAPIGPALGEEYVKMRFGESGIEIIGRRSPAVSLMLVDDMGNSLSAIYERANGQTLRLGTERDVLTHWRALTGEERAALASTLTVRARAMHALAREAEADAARLRSRAAGGDA